MVGAMRSLHNLWFLPGELAASDISGGLLEGLLQLFMSHPSLEQRIAVLQYQYKAYAGDLRHDH